MHETVLVGSNEDSLGPLNNGGNGGRSTDLNNFNNPFSFDKIDAKGDNDLHIWYNI